MLSSYIVRKLAEASKLTTASYRRPVRLRRFAATGEVAHLFNNHKIDELYKLDAGSDITKPLDYVVNQIIHSYVFAPVFERPRKIYGFMFNSDRSKVKELYMVGLRTMAEIFASIANVYLAHRSYIRIEPSGEWKVTSEEDAPLTARSRGTRAEAARAPNRERYAPPTLGPRMVIDRLQYILSYV